jgi:protein-S-isoprenylcysteine O-methyltransferase Ste14
MKLGVYSLFAYVVFLGTLTYLVGFVEGFIVPRALDSPGDAPVGRALLIDVGWFVAFAVQHSAMARPAFKRRWTRIIPAHAERSTYVLVSSMMLLLLFAVWQPIPIVLWDVSGAARAVLIALSLAGFGLGVAATYAIDHFELFGLRPAAESPVFQIPLLYRFVRHPLYLGFLIAFWFAPRMTAGHAVYALGMTIYIAIGIHFEERDLVRTFGETYVRYRENVPAVLPWP